MTTAVALVLGAVLYAISTLFWQDNGVYGTTGAAFMLGALVCWFHGPYAVYGVIELRSPRPLTAWARSRGW